MKLTDIPPTLTGTTGEQYSGNKNVPFGVYKATVGNPHHITYLTNLPPITQDMFTTFATVATEIGKLLIETHDLSKKDLERLQTLFKTYPSVAWHLICQIFPEKLEGNNNSIYQQLGGGRGSCIRYG